MSDSCRRCSGYIDPRADEDGDRSCIHCGYVEYQGREDTVWDDRRHLTIEPKQSRIRRVPERASHYRKRSA